MLRPFGPTSTADEVVAGLDLSGTRAVVTGAASGIGVETARSVARAGAQVHLAVRDVAAGERVAADVRASTGNDGVHVGRLDLADRRSVAGYAAAWDGPLHLLVHNAGIMACPLARTPEGWELQLATNHLGHHALAAGLHRALAQAGRSRIVSVSSIGHVASPVVFDDLHFERRPYDPWQAYGQSKTANVLFAVEASRRWAGDGVVAHAVMPGGILTGLQQHVSQEVKDGWAAMAERGEVVFKTTQQGAATTLVAATDPALGEVGGRYLEDCQVAPTVADDAEVRAGVREWALDPAAAARLWQVSDELLATPLP